MRSLEGRVIVITGASAGIGRATAIEAARRGARVCLIARASEGLEEARDEVAAAGGDAIAAAVDVADAEGVFAAAATCEQTLGPIDVWINNAMATVFGKVVDVSPQEIARVTDVTYLGTVHGTMAALRAMRGRNRGTIVQVGSALAYRGIPLQAAYCAAKHAVKGFTDSLRSELIHDRSAIRLTEVHLPAIDTPQFDWARSHADGDPRPVAPVFAVEKAAAAILHAAVHPKRDYWLGLPVPMIVLGQMLAPGLLDRYLAIGTIEGQSGPRRIRRRRDDNLFAATQGGHAVSGSFGAEARQTALLTSGSAARTGFFVGAGLASAALGFVAGAVFGRRGRTASTASPSQPGRGARTRSLPPRTRR